MTTGSLYDRIAKVLVRSTHPELTPAKVDQLVALGVGKATARLVVDECRAWEREQYPIHWADAIDAATAVPAPSANAPRSTSAPIRNTWGGR